MIQESSCHLPLEDPRDQELPTDKVHVHLHAFSWQNFEHVQDDLNLYILHMSDHTFSLN